MAKQENTEEVVIEVVDDDDVEVVDAKPGILTRIGGGITKAGQKLDRFNQKHKIVSTIATIGTGVLIGAGATVAYVKATSAGDNSNSDDDYSSYLETYSTYDDPTVNNSSDETTTTE